MRFKLRYVYILFIQDDKPLSPNANAKEVAAWLQSNRFTPFIKIFQNFSGLCILVANENTDIL